jgi:hypothetical protein
VSTEPSKPLTIFAPEQLDELLKGWQLHVARRRLIHEATARQAQRGHYIVGSVAAVLAAFAGSSLVSTWNADTSNNALSLVGGITGAAAAVLVAFQTFLDLGARAERHRQSAVEYKALLRRFERLTERRSGSSPCGDMDDTALCSLVEELESELTQIDGKAPVVPARLAADIEGLPSQYVGIAKRLTAAPEGD